MIMYEDLIRPSFRPPKSFSYLDFLTNDSLDFSLKNSDKVSVESYFKLDEDKSVQSNDTSGLFTDQGNAIESLSSRTAQIFNEISKMVIIYLYLTIKKIIYFHFKVVKLLNFINIFYIYLYYYCK